ncbi:MAG: gluconate 2-dehydrogenase subunit 3 family protein [Deltaproteobacteria bacterium]|nr:gluconate 2-dehydrogenase subunit 3 family protein [Deltaproteobacteria bacterium]
MPPVKIRWTPELLRKVGVVQPSAFSLQPSAFSRRRFLGGAVILVCAAPVYRLVTGCAGSGATDAGAAVDAAVIPDSGSDAAVTLDSGTDAGSQPPQVIDGWEVPAGTTLPAEEFAVLAALFDALIPGDDASPGATQCHAAWYLDQLLGAFNVNPPRIYAGGPYSGRHGGLNNFKDFIPLSRVETIRWRTYIEGSNGIPEREFNGPVKGLRAKYEEIFDALTKAAKQAFKQKFTICTLDQRREVLTNFDQDRRQMGYGHAVEGTYGDPVYGGNFEMKGWKVIDYEGDRQPKGFTPRQLLYPEEG